MKNQELLSGYSHFFNRNNYPIVAGKILGLLYTSNQKYFSAVEIAKAIQAEKKGVLMALELLEGYNDIKKTTNEEGSEQHYFVDVKGAVKSLKTTMNDKPLFTDLLEKTMELRDESNAELNDFIKKSIVLNSELVDFVDSRITTYFKN